MFFCPTKEEVTPKLPSDDLAVQYPSHHFQNGGGKPIIQIEQIDYDLKEARDSVKTGIELGELKLPIVIRYMQLSLSRIKCTLEEDWVSFDIKIGSKGESVSPLDLLDVKLIKGPKLQSKTSKGASEEEDHWILFWLLSHYRIGKTQNQNYRESLITRLNEVIKTISPDASDINEGKGTTSGWVNNQAYCKIAAAVDMYFFKFKTDEMSDLRMGTLVCRFRDCAALLAFSHVVKVTNFDAEKILDWIFCGSIGSEIVRMLKPGQELDKSDSYMPYMMDLGLSSKSPYSSIVNPQFHSFAHIIATLLKSERSRHARISTEQNMANVLANAKVVAFVTNKSLDMCKAFAKKGEKSPDEELEEEGTIEIEGEFGMPKSSDPTEWYLYLKDLEFEIPREIDDWVNDESKKLNGSRPNTVGSFLYSNTY
ncbi:nucleoprotein [Curionopolis virus]|uniref:Nucleoprotein n=2 Tax=Curionopolis virus TaxID=490110 RepID=A0A068J4Q8_9RHAB|nr:nucleoprotein [Curionopolis virus]AIE12112.1 N protein [Curionopolis virus]AJR28365.1 nucleoprotein [Curionopolis virus]